MNNKTHSVKFWAHRYQGHPHREYLGSVGVPWADALSLSDHELRAYADTIAGPLGDVPIYALVGNDLRFI